jgi:hypothetical protein
VEISGGEVVEVVGLMMLQRVLPCVLRL